MRTTGVLFSGAVTFLALFAATSAVAEEPGDLLWAKGIKGSNDQFPDNSRGVAAFLDGSSIIVGRFGASAVYGPGEPNETTLTAGPFSTGLFVARYGTTGALAWARMIRITASNAADGFVLGVATFPDGSSVVTGRFGGLDLGSSHTATFGPGEPNQTTMISSWTDVFVARYNADGSLAWARKAGGTGQDAAISVSAFADGSSIITGEYNGSSLFNPGTTVFGQGDPNQTTLVTGPQSQRDCFVARYNADGTLAWARRVVFCLSRSTAAFTDGSSVVTGQFNRPTVFGAGEANATTLVPVLGYDIFVARYNADGSLAWARRDGGGVGGSNTDEAWGVAGFADGSSVVTGNFAATTLFGQGEANATTLVSAGGSEIFLARYNANGTLAWARRAGSSFSGFSGSQTESGSGVATFSDGSSVVTGRFFETAVFGPGEPNQTTLVSAGGDDVFVAVYDADGRLAWARRAGGVFREDGRGVGSFADGSFVITGNLNGAAVFGSGELSQTTIPSGFGRFLTRYAGGEDPEIVAPANIVQECDDTDEHATVNFVFDVTPGPADLLRVRDLTGTRTLLDVSSPAEQQYGVGPVEFPHGSSTVLIELLDGATVVASATFAVQIEDTIAPVISGAVDQTIELGGPLTTLYRSMLGITALDECDPAPTLTLAPGAVALGTTAVTAIASDATGNTTVETFDVTVLDTTDPLFSVVPADVERHCEAGGTLISFDVLAEDLSGSVTIVCADQTGRIVSPSATLFDVGVHTVTCTATDASGNDATWSFQVTIIDDEAPAIVVPADITVGTAPGVAFAFVDFAVTATDACDPDAGIVCTAPWGVVQSGDAFPLGATPVTCTATDHSGNAATASFSVTVQDREAPMLTGPASATLVTECARPRCSPRRSCGRRQSHSVCLPASLTVSAASLGITATDNCDPDVAITWAPASVGLGTTPVVFTARDEDGNQSQKTVQVAVLQGPFDVRFQRPLDGRVDNKIRAGRTVPVKVRVSCDNQVEDEVTAVIDRVEQIDGAGTSIGNEVVEEAGDCGEDDEGNAMRLVGSHYQFNLSTSDWPSTKGARFRVVVRISKTGHVDSFASVILKNK